MKVIVALDPGDRQTAMVIYHPVSKTPLVALLEDNKDIKKTLHNIRACILEHRPDILVRGEKLELEVVIEMVASYGMPVGRTIFDTCVWIGRYIDTVLAAGYPVQQAPTTDAPKLLVRKEIKMHLCNSNRAKDSNVTQAIVDRYGGTMKRAKGTKKEPGPLFGFKSDIWAAMGVAITVAEAGDKCEFYELFSKKEDA